LRVLRRDPISGPDSLRWLRQGCVLALELWDDESAHALSQDHLRTARSTGALAELSLALGSHTPVLVFCGELPAAAALAEQARSLDEAAGIRGAPYGALVLAGWRGRPHQAKALIEETMRTAGSRGDGFAVAISQYADAVLCNSLGRYDEALVAARRACLDQREVIVHNWGLPEVLESAVRCGRRDLAEGALRRLSRKATASGTAWALGIEARCRALLSDGDAAEAMFRTAVDRLSAVPVRADLARAHLLFGEWLRRADRRTAAREELETAYEMFTASGMAGFAARAQGELAAAGVTGHRPAADVRHRLTAQEAQIAGLARDGLSNSEIGAQIFLSARTVEWHLRKVFTKLGVTSRRQLRDLPDSGVLVTNA
jgi:ATP/maltotriose-dependent transcriptional regulator MalT